MASTALIGYRGTGKSTVGRLLAKQLGQRFLDTDEAVETQQGESIASIFARGGEGLFRNAESEALNTLTSYTEPLVISGGGGIVLRKKNRDLLRHLAPGRIILLTASPETIVRRISSDPRSAQTRPALTTLSFQDEIKTILEMRTPIYEELADHTVNTEGKTPEMIAAEILLLF